MIKFKKVLKNIFALPAILLIYFYKIFISPLIPKTCGFYPTCSTYSLNAIKEFGIIKGGWLSFKRIIKCNGKQKQEFIDYVPQNIKGDYKWLI